MCTYDGYVSPYLLRPPRSCDQVMGTNRVQPRAVSPAATQDRVATREPARNDAGDVDACR